MSDLVQALVDEIERLRDCQIELSRIRNRNADPLYGLTRTVVYEELETSYSKILRDIRETSISKSEGQNLPTTTNEKAIGQVSTTRTR